MKSRIILETPTRNKDRKGLTYLLHDELKNVAKELLKSEGYKKEEIQTEFKEDGFIYDVVAIRKGKIEKVIECGGVSAQKLFFCLNKFKENFYNIPYAKHDCLLYSKKTMEEILKEHKQKVKELEEEIQVKEEEIQRNKELATEKIASLQKEFYKYEALLKRLVGNFKTIETTRKQIEEATQSKRKELGKELFG